MEAIEKLAEKASQRLTRLAQSSAVATEPISVGGRHVLPLCELSIAFGGGGGQGEAENDEHGAGAGQGKGGAAAGAAKAVPVALLIIDEQGARIETLGA
jgi:uncharacterized spore protein YtfJ